MSQVNKRFHKSWHHQKQYMMDEENRGLMISLDHRGFDSPRFVNVFLKKKDEEKKVTEVIIGLKIAFKQTDLLKGSEFDETKLMFRKTLTLWLDKVKKKKEVQILEIELDQMGEIYWPWETSMVELYRVPQRVLSTDSIKTLSLKCCEIFLKEKPTLPSLEILKLEMVYTKVGKSFELLIRGCTKLEHLLMKKCKVGGKVILKNVTILEVIDNVYDLTVTAPKATKVVLSGKCKLKKIRG